GGDEPARHPVHVLRQAGGHAVAAPLRLAHHREGGVLVDLEVLERIGDEEEVHGAFFSVAAAFTAFWSSRILHAGAMALPPWVLLPRPSCCTASASAPATTPQKAEPMPAIVTPDSVTRKVMRAASRCDSSRTAAASP